MEDSRVNIWRSWYKMKICYSNSGWPELKSAPDPDLGVLFFNSWDQSIFRTGMANTAVRRWNNTRELLVMVRVPLPQSESSCHVGHNTKTGLWATLLTRDSSKGGRELHSVVQEATVPWHTVTYHSRSWVIPSLWICGAVNHKLVGTQHRTIFNSASWVAVIMAKHM